MHKFNSVFVFFFLVIFYACTEEESIPLVPDTTAPTVNLSIAGLPNVVAGEAIVVSNKIEINIDANDEGGVAKIEAFINDVKVGEDTMPPYAITIDVSSYASKAGKTGNYKNYTLKIVATDKVGNSSSSEIPINIDNEIPSITEVSLGGDEVINGDLNTVLFAVVDNQEVSSVLVYLNEELLYDIKDEVYEVNIDTSALTDGENTLKIEAKDNAQNIASHEVQFIVDNTGPIILLESIIEGQEIDESIRLEPQVSDVYSAIASLEIFYKETSLMLFDSTATNFETDFDPNAYEVGDGKLTIEAKDNLGNTSQLEVSINILRLILKITIPEGYFSPAIQSFHKHYVFASKMDGTLIDVEEIRFPTREVKLHSVEEFENSEQFTLTYASMGNNGESSYLYSLSNFNREFPKNINLEASKRFKVANSNLYPISGFDASTEVYAFGKDYHFTSSAEGDKLLQLFDPVDHQYKTNDVYVYSYNPLVDFYNYQFVEKPIPADFEINFEDFSDENLEQKQFTTVSSTFYTNNSKSFSIYGYQSQEDMENDIFHKIWEYGYGVDIPFTSYEYQLNTQFYAYAHELIIGNYYSRGLGLPNDVIDIPNWTVDYSFQNNTLNLVTSENSHTNIEIYAEGGYDVGSPYVWNLVYDSATNDEIVLPEIPSELQNFGFYNQFQNAELEIQRVGLLKYKEVDSYADYIENIVLKNNSFGKAAPQFESIFSGDYYPIFNADSYLYNK
ncbi:Ig-like domain-containing protein [Cellulophaga sp. F20128]|uniref:Ig-like domain-containing protein n=1 Tax=Cellulophaga sp. F20128 TaxID=2926413 RepID=UPI001FF552C0|nr:Ig-like domain-containing protein [Cellulophaga sp. F20128]MCK0157828.1 Ig-like domain-containing protein [Cellulophaga sp. F20128]